MRLIGYTICLLGHLVAFRLDIAELSEQQRVLLASFRHADASNYSNMLLVNGHLYASATSHIFRLDALDVSNVAAGDDGDGAFRHRLIHATNNESTPGGEKTKKNNFITLLRWRETSKDLIVCATNRGMPHVYDLKGADLSNQLEYNGVYLCPGVNDRASLGLVSFDTAAAAAASVVNSGKRLNNNNNNGGGVMYSAVWLSPHHYGIYRKEIEINRSLLRTPTTTTLTASAAQHWLWQPHFVAVHEDVHFVYFFFTELAIETAPERRVSRLARVCKNDKGGVSDASSVKNNVWSSFRKMTLTCSCDRDRARLDQFDALFGRGLASVELSELAYVGQLGEDTFVGVFHHEPTGSSGSVSVLCELDVAEVRAELSRRQFWTNGSKPAMFEDIVDCEPTGQPAYGQHEALDGNLALFYDFLATHTLLAGRVSATCKLAVPARIVSFRTDMQQRQPRTLYLIDSARPEILVTSVHANGTYRLNKSPLNVNQPDGGKTTINDVLVSGPTMYVSTQSAIHQLNLTFALQKLATKEQSSNATQYEHVSVVANQSVMLDCGSAAASDNQVVVWTRDGVEIASSRVERVDTQLIVSSEASELVILHAQANQSGIYTCTSRISDHTKRMVFNVSVILPSTMCECNKHAHNYSASIRIIREWKNELNRFNSRLGNMSNECNLN